MSAAAKAAPNVPEIAKMVELAHSAGLKLNNERSLTTAADGVSKQLPCNPPVVARRCIPGIYAKHDIEIADCHRIILD